MVPGRESTVSCSWAIPSVIWRRLSWVREAKASPKVGMEDTAVRKASNSSGDRLNSSSTVEAGRPLGNRAAPVGVDAKASSP